MRKSIVIDGKQFEYQYKNGYTYFFLPGEIGVYVFDLHCNIESILFTKEEISKRVYDVYQTYANRELRFAEIQRGEIVYPKYPIEDEKSQTPNP